MTFNVKQTVSSKLLFRVLIFLDKCRLLSLKSIVAIANHSLDKGAFKYKADNGKWRNLSIGNLEV